MIDPSRSLPARPEILRDPGAATGAPVVERPISVVERILAVGAIRKTLLLAALAGAWEAYARHLDNPLLFPTFGATLSAFLGHLADGTLPARAWLSVQTLLVGYALGVGVAALFTAFAIGSRVGNDLLETLTAMFNPLPAIALLPLALVWFGLGSGSIVFVIVHSVLWAIALNTHSGFRAVSPTLEMVGRNYGLRGLRLVRTVLVPAALPAILTGLKIGWAFAWRTLIAAELVFGVSSGQGGLGWFIFESKNQLEIASVFAGLFAVVVIGLAVENVVFLQAERRTVRRWGLQT